MPGRRRLSHLVIFIGACHSLSVWGGVKVQLLPYICYSGCYLPLERFCGVSIQKEWSSIFVNYPTLQNHEPHTNVNRLCFYFGPIKMINLSFTCLRELFQAPNGMCFDKIEMPYKLFMANEYQQVDWIWKVLTKPMGLLLLKKIIFVGYLQGTIFVAGFMGILRSFSHQGKERFMAGPLRGHKGSSEYKL